MKSAKFPAWKTLGSLLVVEGPSQAISILSRNPFDRSDHEATNWIVEAIDRLVAKPCILRGESESRIKTEMDPVRNAGKGTTEGGDALDLFDLLERISESSS